MSMLLLAVYVVVSVGFTRKEFVYHAAQDSKRTRKLLRGKWKSTSET